MSDITQKHKIFISELFDRTANDYGSVGPDFFDYFGNRIVEHAEIKSDHIVLDIACGRGASLFPAVTKIGDSGKVIGIDLAPEMIRNTRLESEKRGIQNIKLQEMDVEDLKFYPNTFDVALCGFSLFFLPNLELALSEINRVLKPEGVFVTSSFGER